MTTWRQRRVAPMRGRAIRGLASWTLAVTGLAIGLGATTDVAAQESDAAVDDPLSRVVDALIAGTSDAHATGLDPWLVTDELCARGAAARAQEWVGAVVGPGTARLPEFVIERASRTPPAALRAAVRAAELQTDASAWDVKSLATAAASDAPLLRARASSLLAARASAAGLHGDAATHDEAAGTAADSIGWATRAAAAWRAAGIAARRSGDLVRARDDWTHLLAAQTTLEDRTGQAFARMFLGNVYGELGDHLSSLRWFEAAEADFVALGAATHAVRVRGNRAYLYALMGRLPEARRLYERMLRDLPDENTDDTRRQLASQLAILCGQLGDHERALELLDVAIALSPAEDADRLARLRGDRGTQRMYLDDAAGALEDFAAARDQFARTGDVRGRTNALMNIGYLHLREGRLDAAAQALTNALELSEPSGDAAVFANGQQLLAEVHRRSGRLAEARRLHETALATARDRALPAYIRDGLTGLARIDLAEGDVDAAVLRSLDAARRTSELLAGLVTQAAARARDRHFEAFRVAMDAATRPVDGEADRAATVLELAERSRAAALLTAIEGREALRAARVPEPLLQSQRQASQAVADARKAFAEALNVRNPDGSRAASLKDVRAARDALQAAQVTLDTVRGEVRAAAAGAAELLDPQPVALDTIRGALDAETAFVHYVLMNDRAVALVTTTEGARLVQLGDRAEISDACAGLQSGGGDDWVTHGAALRDLAVAPLALADGIRRVVVCPDAELLAAPLPLAFGARTVVQVPSASTWISLRGRTPEPGRGVLALGGANCDARLAPLAGAADEATAVGTHVLTGDAATEAALRAGLARTERWRAIHVACHGVIDADHPMRSFLALTPDGDDDGALTAEEVLDLDVRADVVVLSACDSGRGRVYRGEGLLGLARAFVFAGAPRIVCSLWKVPDDATSALMTAFHAALAEGATASDALARAQAEVRGRERWAHARNWAGWVLWGME